MNEKRMMQCREMTRCEDDAKELNRLIGEAEKLNASTDSELNYAFHEWADDAIERLAGGETVSLVSPGNREMTLRVKIMQTMKEYRSRRAELSKRVEHLLVSDADRVYGVFRFPEGADALDHAGYAVLYGESIDAVADWNRFMHLKQDDGKRLCITAAKYWAGRPAARFVSHPDILNSESVREAYGENAEILGRAIAALMSEALEEILATVRCVKAYAEDIMKKEKGTKGRRKSVDMEGMFDLSHEKAEFSQTVLEALIDGEDLKNAAREGSFFKTWDCYAEFGRRFSVKFEMHTPIGDLIAASMKKALTGENEKAVKDAMNVMVWEHLEKIQREIRPYGAAEILELIGYPDRAFRSANGPWVD